MYSFRENVWKMSILFICLTFFRLCLTVFIISETFLSPVYFILSIIKNENIFYYVSRKIANIKEFDILTPHEIMEHFKNEKK